MIYDFQAELHGTGSLEQPCWQRIGRAPIGLPNTFGFMITQRRDFFK